MKASVYIATSLDGYIAREDGSLDWLPGSDGSGDGDGEDYGYQAFMDSVDALIMGRNTYETVRKFGQWPYGDKTVLVLTSRPLQIPAEIAATVETQAWSPQEVIQQFAARGANHLYIDGGNTIQRFLRSGLIQQLIITRIPVLIGSGIPLFGPLDQDIKLRHIKTQAFASGLVQSTYQIS